MTAWWL